MSPDPYQKDPRKNPYEDIFSQSTQKDKADEEKLFSQKKESSPGFEAIALNAMKKIIDLFTLSTERTISQAEQTFIEDDLKKLRDDFEKLKKIDFSQNPPFLNSLSLTWHDFLKNYKNLYANSTSPMHQKIEKLIHSISSYPETAENNMGYYLSEYAGETWLPFPYMDILQKLHQEQGDDSHLNQWIDLINDIISDIKKRKPTLS